MTQMPLDLDETVGPIHYEVSFIARAGDTKRVAYSSAILSDVFAGVAETLYTKLVRFLSENPNVGRDQIVTLALTAADPPFQN